MTSKNCFWPELTMPIQPIFEIVRMHSKVAVQVVVLTILSNWKIGELDDDFQNVIYGLS